MNPYIASFNIFIFLIIGCLLFIKTYFVFDYLFYDNEEYIAIYLILNFLYYIILLLKQNTLIKFANIISSVLFIGGMFSIFSFEDKGMVSFLYSAVAILISLLFSFFIFMLLENKFKTNKIEDFLKISPKNRILKFFIIFGFLNLVKMPGLPLFTSFLIGLLMIFSTDYDGFILNLMPYVLIFGTFLVSIYVLNLLYKILIEPQAPISYDSVLSRHQVLVLFICAIAVIICGIYPQYFFDGNF